MVLSNSAVNCAMVEYELYELRHAYRANQAELACMDACLVELNRRQAIYSAGAAAAVFGATHFPPYARLPLGARLVATAGAAFFAADIATHHATRSFLHRLASLGPASPLGQHLSRKFGILPHGAPEHVAFADGDDRRAEATASISGCAASL
ncbi:hypothetical protein KFE25_006876 [Diacronema lutheri]|uniref:Uncharacterized protein n=1 Tax=Diacronema lutheri TaxID=2081491 RepID=A0A8J5XWN0_DIALT|nr:hypothetical protein KFE25_006876 [Diacronema lutheri]